MKPATEVSTKERRAAVRLAATGRVNAVVLDESNQVQQVLEDVRAINVSAGGLALKTRSTAPQGARVRVTVDNSPSFVVEALEQLPLRDGSSKIRCRLLEGRVPARLMHGW